MRHFTQLPCMAYAHHAVGNFFVYGEYGVWLDVRRIMPPPHTQVDGEYEDWLEVLRLMYHGGNKLH